MCIEDEDEEDVFIYSPLCYPRFLCLPLERLQLGGKKLLRLPWRRNIGKVSAAAVSLVKSAPMDYTPTHAPISAARGGGYMYKRPASWKYRHEPAFRSSLEPSSAPLPPCCEFTSSR
ncbi:hypothetical protein EYF80_034143 [Liparis tanakae]|uniref:Uncharacterized protein n=1 Tax=Liparis tanakae TaxID=230148 RepID=A0A4Z2GPZ7_9TELE|nr:hypothetical protein EYF80_034143 [Liparis tanakae]